MASKRSSELVCAVLAVVALALLPIAARGCFASREERSRLDAEREGWRRQSRPAGLEAWIRLRSCRGAPLLVAAAGYRLGLLCEVPPPRAPRIGARPAATGPRVASGAVPRARAARRARPAAEHPPSTSGWVVFAGPFPGRAYLSSRLVPRGQWVRLRGLWQGRTVQVLIGERPDIAGRLLEPGPGFPLGYDPWDAAVPTPPGAAPSHGALDGDVGPRRLIDPWRKLRRPTVRRGSALLGAAAQWAVLLALMGIAAATAIAGHRTRPRDPRDPREPIDG